MIDKNDQEATVATADTGTRMPARRILAIIVAACVVLLAIVAATATGLAVATSVHNGTTDMALRMNDGSRSSGDPGGVSAQSIATQTIVAIPELSPLAIGLHLAGGALAAIAPLAIAWFAARLGLGLWRGRPFAAPVARELLIASAALLALTIASQLVLWVSRAAALSELPEGGSQFSYWPEFDPLLTVTALGLLIVALAFQLGSRADRITEGLV
jgi:hypothetical protein